MKRFFLFLFVLVLAGCARTKNPIVPVTGTVAFASGAKLPVGTRVIFRPQQGGLGHSEGSTDADGNFTLRHKCGRSGAETGTYSVILGHPDEATRHEFYRQVPQSYWDDGVSVDVTTGMAPVAIIVKPAVKKRL